MPTTLAEGVESSDWQIPEIDDASTHWLTCWNADETSRDLRKDVEVFDVRFQMFHDLQYDRSWMWEANSASSG